jgi:hypothetical protein
VRFEAQELWSKNRSTKDRFPVHELSLTSYTPQRGISFDHIEAYAPLELTKANRAEVQRATVTFGEMIYSGASWYFVFGQASPRERVRVYKLRALRSCLLRRATDA